MLLRHERGIDETLWRGQDRVHDTTLTHQSLQLHAESESGYSSIPIQISADFFPRTGRGRIVRVGLAAHVELSFLSIRNWKRVRICYNTIPHLFSQLNSFGNAQLEDFFKGEGDMLTFSSFSNSEASTYNQTVPDTVFGSQVTKVLLVSIALYSKALHSYHFAKHRQVVP